MELRLGDLLIESGALNREQVQHILETQEREGSPFGVLAERLYGVDPAVTEAAWAPPLLSTGGAVALGLAGSMLFARVILVGSRAEPGPSPVPADPT